jgi:branched-chain amino acid transport system ATP-binding protein
MALLEARQVSKYFRGLHAVEGVDAVVEKGEIFGIIGPNGAGKTTFLNLCGGTFPVTKGRFIFDGEDITNLPSWKIAKKGISRTFQSIQLFNSMTVLENVIVGFHISEKSVMADAIFRTKRFISEKKDIEQKAIALLQKLGLDSYKSVLAKNLSYGMQRKVEIARALATNPKLLLLDEPAAGMNPNETRALLEFIKGINKEGYTIIVIEHDVKFMIQLCDRIMVLNYGKKISEGTPSEVRNDPLVIEAYFGKGRVAQQGGA